MEGAHAKPIVTGEGDSLGAPVEGLPARASHAITDITQILADTSKDPNERVRLVNARVRGYHIELETVLAGLASVIVKAKAGADADAGEAEASGKRPRTT